MIALILLILAVIVIGGGIEVVRRMRLGGGAAAAHHRALDTLGQLTNQGADRRVDLAPSAGTPLLDHVRRVVEADPTHPRISPRPMSRPVAIPAAVLGGEAPAAAPEEVATRPAPTEIEGVRILLPDPPPPPPEEAGDDDVALDEVDTDDIDVGESDVDEVDVDGEVEADEGSVASGVDGAGDSDVGESDVGESDVAPGDVDRGHVDEGHGDESHGDEGHGDPEVDGADEAYSDEALTDDVQGDDVEPGGAVLDTDQGGAGDKGMDGDGRVAAAHAGTAVVVRIDDDATPSATMGDDPGAPAEDDGGGAGVGDLLLATTVGTGADVTDGDPEPAWPGGPIAGTPVAPPTAVDGAESVRVVRVDDADGHGPAAVFPDRIPPPPAPRPQGDGEPEVAARSRDQGSSLGAPQGLDGVEGFRILAPSETSEALSAREAESPSVASDASETVTDEVAAVAVPPAADDHPRRPSGGAPAVAGTFHPAAPEQTRAQLAALARSGRVEPAGAAAGDGPGAGHRSHNAHSRRGGGHARSTRHPVHHRGLRMATAMLAVVVVAVGIVAAVVIGNQGTGNRARASRTVTPATAAPTTTTTALAPPASLVSKTTSTATYQVTGSPTISFIGSGSCWIEIRQGDQTGKVLFEGVLSPGNQKSQTGPFWVRLGNPGAISVQINGTVLSQPASNPNSPYNLQFQ